MKKNYNYNLYFLGMELGIGDGDGGGDGNGNGEYFITKKKTCQLHRVYFHRCNRRVSTCIAGVTFHFTPDYISHAPTGLVVL